MPRTLPSLNQLRAFEAAARHESIKLGAEELFVTPAAVSHQIKGLEQALNTTLFSRHPRKITLTDEGRELALQIGSALDSIENAITRARKPDPSGILKITIAPFFGNRWLLPRLQQFHATHPDIEIKPFMSFDYIDLKSSGFDAALRYGAGDWEGMTSVLICNDHVRPVCAPQLVDGLTLPLPTGQVLELPLACAGRWRDDWTAWAEASGAKIPLANTIAEYESRAYMFDAALSGQAVILADSRMTAADEAAGRLVSLNALAIDRPQGIHVVYENCPGEDPRLARFITWLKQQALA